MCILELKSSLPSCFRLCNLMTVRSCLLLSCDHFRPRMRVCEPCERAAASANKAQCTEYISISPLIRWPHKKVQPDLANSTAEVGE